MVKIGSLQFPVCGTVSFPRWKVRMFHALRLEGVHEAIDHEDPIHPFTYHDAVAPEKCAKAFAIMSTMLKDQDMFRSTHEGVDSAYTLFGWLNAKYNTQFDSELKALKTKFNSHKMHQSEKVDAYIDRLLEVHTELDAYGKPEFVSSIVQILQDGARPEFSMRLMVYNQTTSLANQSVEGLRQEMKAVETARKLGNDNTSAQALLASLGFKADAIESLQNASAFQASTSERGGRGNRGPNRGRGRGRNNRGGKSNNFDQYEGGRGRGYQNRGSRNDRGRGRGRGRYNASERTCLLCNQAGHMVAECPHNPFTSAKANYAQSQQPAAQTVQQQNSYAPQPQQTFQNHQQSYQQPEQATQQLTQSVRGGGGTRQAPFAGWTGVAEDGDDEDRLRGTIFSGDVLNPIESAVRLEHYSKCVLDSGADEHMTACEALLHDIVPCNNLQVKVASGQFIRATGRGVMRVKAIVDGVTQL